MVDTNNKMPPWMLNLVMELKRDKRKTLILAVALVVGLVVIGRAVFKTPNPEQASAGTVIAVGKRATPMPAQSSSSGSSQEGKRDKYVLEMSRTITRDLFAMDAKYFPIQEVKAPTTQEAPPASQPDLTPDPEIARQNILAQAKTLSVQSVVLGSTPTAIINDRVLRVGGWINEFQVKSITVDGVMIEKNGVTHTLTIKSD